MKTINEIKRIEIEEVIYDESAEPEYMIQGILESLNLKYRKITAGTGTIYFTIPRDEDSDDYIKIRLANHSKARYLGRDVDLNIEYSDDYTNEDIYDELYQGLLLYID